MPLNEALYEGQQISMQADQQLPGSLAPRLTSQEQMFVAALNAGASITEASRRCGISPVTGAKWRKREDIDVALAHYQNEFARDIAPRVRFDVEDAHHMYMEAYRNSANATEQIKATDSLVKLHGLNDTKRNETPEEKEVNTLKQLERMSAAELTRLAGHALASLLPDEAAEGEYTDVEA